MRVGCPSDDTIRHCLFSNIVCRSRNGIFCENPIRYLRKDCNGYLSVSDIRFEHWDLECSDTPLRINVEGGISLRGVERLEFRDFRFRSREPIYLTGNATTPLRDIVLCDFSGVVAKETPIVASCVERLRLKDFEVTSGPGEVAKLERKPSRSWETQF